MSSQPTPTGHYVYVHKRASDLTLFYVGKGNRRRAWGTSGRNAIWKRIVKKHGLCVEIVKSDLSEPCALSMERALIFALRPACIANIVDGGGGTAGWKHSAETRARIGAFHKGRTLTPKMRAAIDFANANRVITPEMRQKMSAAKKGVKRGPLSEQTKAKISAAHVGMRPTLETLEKLRLSHIGKSCGRNSPTYDHVIRHFIHTGGAEFIGTRADFIATHNLAHGCVSSVISGKQKTVKGWRLV